MELFKKHKIITSIIALVLILLIASGILGVVLYRKFDLGEYPKEIICGADSAYTGQYCAQSYSWAYNCQSGGDVNQCTRKW